MKSSILYFRVEGFFYLWQDITHFFCHGLQHNKTRFEDKKYDPKRDIPDN